MRRLTLASCRRIASLCLSLFVACSSGGAPTLVDPDDSDGGLNPPSRDGGLPDLAMGAGPSCETPCWRNPLPQGDFLQEVWRDSTGNGWAVGVDSVVRIEGDRASLVRHPVWKQQNFLEAVWGSGPSDVWVAGTAVLHFDGKTWTDFPEFSWKGIQDVWGSGPSDVWLVGISGQIHHYDGKSWSKVPSGITTALFQISGQSASSIWAGGEYGTLLFYNGSTWTKQTSPTTEQIGSLSCSASGDCYMLPYSNLGFPSIAVDGANVFRLEGGRWVKQNTPMGARFYSVTSVSPSEVWLSGVSNYLYGGSSYTKTEPNIYSLHSIAAQGGPAMRGQLGVGNRGLIGKFDGTTWRDLSSGKTEDLRSVYSSPQGDIFAVGYAGTVLRIHDGQLIFGGISGDSSSYLGVWGSSASDVFAVGEYGRVMHFDGATWTALPERFGGSGEKLTAVSGSSKSDVWAVGDQGTIIHSDGVRFSTVTSGLPIKSLACVWAASPSDVWVGGKDGKLGHFDGSKWTLWPQSMPKDVVALWGSSSTDVWAAGGWNVDKTLFVSRWNGTSWVAQTLPAGLTYPASISGSGPSDVWIGGHYGELVHFDGVRFSAVPLGTNFAIFGVGKSPKTHYAVGDGGLVIQLDGQ